MTHFMNAMAPFHHRAPGPVAWGLSRDDVTCDIIADGNRGDTRAELDDLEQLSLALEQLVVQKLFLGAQALDLEHGITDSTPEIAQVEPPLREAPPIEIPTTPGQPEPVQAGDEEPPPQVVILDHRPHLAVGQPQRHRVGRCGRAPGSRRSSLRHGRVTSTRCVRSSAR